MKRSRLVMTAAMLAIGGFGLHAARAGAAHVHLLDQSGADSVISTSSAAGRLLGMATHTPGIANVISDMLEIGQGVDIRQYDVGPEGVTAEVREEWGPIVALQREGELISFEDERCKNPQPGDRVVALHSHT